MRGQLITERLGRQRRDERCVERTREPRADIADVATPSLLHELRKDRRHFADVGLMQAARFLKPVGCRPPRQQRAPLLDQIIDIEQAERRVRIVNPDRQAACEIMAKVATQEL